MDVQDQLNRTMPAARDALLGDALNDLITTHNALVDQFIANSTTGVSVAMKVLNGIR